jgi:hypothetical protein
MLWLLGNARGGGNGVAGWKRASFELNGAVYQSDQSNDKNDRAHRHQRLCSEHQKKGYWKKRCDGNRAHNATKVIDLSFERRQLACLRTFHGDPLCSKRSIYAIASKKNEINTN